jgi:hypothetical protein
MRAADALRRCALPRTRCTLQRKTRELARKGDGDGGYRIAFGESFDLCAWRLPQRLAACHLLAPHAARARTRAPEPGRACAAT